jgi:hypothetical protein
MALYEFQGQEFDIPTDDPVEAKAKIQAYLGKSTPPKETSFLGGVAGEIASGAKVVAGAPEFLYSAIGTPIQAASQMILDGTVNWDKASKDAKRIASPLGKLVTPVDLAIDSAGLREEYEQAKITQGLEALTKSVEWVGQKVEDQTGVPKAATVAALDIGMLGVGVPGVKPLARAIEKRVAPDVATSSSKPIVEGTSGVEVPASTAPIVYARPDYTFNPDLYIKDTVGIPKVEAEAKAFDNSLYELNNLPKADLTDAINTHKTLEEMGLTLEMQQKFQRYDEGQALGNEKINNEVYELNKKINEIYSENQSLFQEGNYKSPMNPEGVVPWKDFAFKDQVRDNYTRIEELKKEKEAVEARRGSREELTPQEKEIYQRYFEPVRTEIQRLTEYLEKKELVPSFGKDKNFASRKSMYLEKDRSLADIYKEALIGRDYTEQRRSEAGVTPAGEQRTYYVLEDAKGKREVVSIVPGEKNTAIIPMRNKALVKDKAVYIPKEVSTLTGEKVLGKTIREATVPELELNTPTVYAKDYSLVMGERLADLKEQARLNEWVDTLVSDPQFKSVLWKPKNQFEKPPMGFRQLEHTDRMPKLREYYFENRYAEMLDDFNKPMESNALTKINNSLITNMMLVPIAHMHNELFHWGVTRGASGFLNPGKVLSMVQELPVAAKEVMQRGDLYKEILREGGSTMSANIRNSTYLEKNFNDSVKQLSETKGFKDLAKSVGRSPADLYQGISKFSNKSMWTVRDILYTQLIMEKKKQGLTTKEAIASVERHMPNYRLGSRLTTQRPIGREISKVLGNRKYFLFARYHAGMLGSAKNTIKDLLALDPNVKKSKQFKEGLDSALAISLAMSVLYPLLDDVASMVSESVADFTGDEGKIAKAKLRRPGISHVFDTIYEVAGNEKDAYSLASILMTPSPVLSLAVETAMNKELYNSRPITNMSNDTDIMVDQYLSYLLRKVPQASQAMQASNEDYGAGAAGIILRNFFDTKTQTQDQLDRIEDQVERRKTEAEDLEYEGLFVRR